MKIIAQSLGNKLEKEEEQAARRLLEVLRNARLKEQEQEENEARTSEYRSGLFNLTETYDFAAYNDSENSSGDYEMSSPRNDDKKSLRNSLEKLISLYLTKLREDSVEVGLDQEDDNDSSQIRERRDLMTRRMNRRRKLIPGKCKAMKRRIGTLDQNEIEKSLRNFTSTEFNIRKLLNYRWVDGKVGLKAQNFKFLTLFYAKLWKNVFSFATASGWFNYRSAQPDFLSPSRKF